MVRGAVAAVALAAVLAMAGCIQVEVPVAGAAPQAAPAVDETPPDKFAVTCRLLDGNGTPLAAGTCDYRFGGLGAAVKVDADGSAVRMVPAGATGTVTGTAPGHAGAKATLTVTADKTVRMTLPALAKNGPPPADPAAAPRPANGTAPQAAPANDTTLREAEVFEPVLVTLLDETYITAPVELPDTTYRFAVPADIDTLELVGIYEYAPFVTVPMVTLYGPDGQEVGYHNRLLYTYYPAVGNAKEIPMIYVLDPAPGEYRLSVSGAATTPVRIIGTGYAGTAPDFSFTPLGGASTTLSAFQGKVVLVDLMATWCGPCHDAMPGLKDLAREYGDRLTILSVDIDETETSQELAAMQDRYDAEWIWGFENGGSASAAYGSGYIPTFAIVDARGGLVYRQVGAVDEDLARELIDAALARSGSP